MLTNISHLTSTMSTQDNLSSLPPATLRAALEASEKRIRRQEEREKIEREIRKLQERLGELDEGEDAVEIEPEKKAIAGGSQRKAKRPRVDSPSDDEANPRNDRLHSPSCTRYGKRGVQCMWGKTTTSRSCLACQHSKSGCDLKRPIDTSP